MIYIKKLLFLTLSVVSCQSMGQLEFIADIANVLTEVSAVEVTRHSNFIWVIEDSGNSNTLYGLNVKGHIKRSITISNAKNKDWEDLTSDSEGNIYIGDFGNNNETRQTFQIYKISHKDLNKTVVAAEIIEFKLPKDQDSKDFESFFLFNNAFYIFSKERQKLVVLKVPNNTGTHVAEVHANYNLKGKDNRITSADISDDGKSIVLLNHDKLWKLSNFKTDDFFAGQIKLKAFGHHSQKEGICFSLKNTVLVTDERKGADGGNIYSFNHN